jgi:hypothetical protein
MELYYPYQSFLNRMRSISFLIKNFAATWKLPGLNRIMKAINSFYNVLNILPTLRYLY